MSDQTLELVIKARDQSNAAFDSLLKSLKETEKQQEKTKKSTEGLSDKMGKFAGGLDTTAKKLAGLGAAAGLPADKLRTLSDVADVASLGLDGLTKGTAGFNAASLGAAGAGLALGTAIGSWLNTFPAVQRGVDSLRDSLLSIVGASSAASEMATAMQGMGDFQKRMAASNEEAVKRQIEGMKRQGKSLDEIAEFYKKSEKPARTAIDRVIEEAAARKKAAEATKAHMAEVAKTTAEFEKARKESDAFVKALRDQGTEALKDIGKGQDEFFKKQADMARARGAQVVEDILAEQKAREQMEERARQDAEDAAEAERERHQKMLSDLDAIAGVFAQIGGPGFGQLGDILTATVSIADAIDNWKAGGAGLSGILSKASGVMGIAGTAFGLGKKLFFGGQEEHKKVNDLRDEYIKAAGGLDALDKKAHEAGLTLNDLLNAKKVDTYNAAVEQLNKSFDETAKKRAEALALEAAANDKLTAAMDKYGISIDQLGPKFAQQKLDEQAMGLLESWKLLEAAGVSYDTLLKQMGPDLEGYIQTAMKAGSTIPAAFRPVVEQMAEQGKLVDENGKKYESAEEAGLTFAETMTEATTRAADATLRLIEALERVFGLSGREVTIPVNFPTRGGGEFEGGGRFREPEGMADGDRTITRWGVPAILHGTRTNPEFVNRGDQIEEHVRRGVERAGGGGGGQPIVLHNHFHVGGREVAVETRRYMDLGAAPSKSPLRGRRG